MSLPDKYWPCPLCLITLLVAHSEGLLYHEEAYRALEVSGLVEDWETVRVKTTEKGRQFVDMLLGTPLPEHKWIDPRGKPCNQGCNHG